MKQDIKTLIESVVRQRLGEARVQKVIVKEDEDNEGDRILRVMVVFDGSKGSLDAHKMSGLARHLRAKMEEHDAFLHPVFRFVSQKEAKKVLSAAA